MKIQLNTDRNVQVDDALTQMVENEVRSALAHFETRLTRVEVHLGDENGPKRGVGDKKCLLEARPEGLHPIVASAHGKSLQQACHEAARKLHTALENTFGRLDRDSR